AADPAAPCLRRHRRDRSSRAAREAAGGADPGLAIAQALSGSAAFSRPGPVLCSRAMPFALLCAAALAAGAAISPDRDLEFLRSYTQTRGWALGKPTRITVLPDGSAVLFLRAQPRKAENRLFRFDVATGQVRELVTPEQVLGSEPEQLSAEER